MCECVKLFDEFESLILKKSQNIRHFVHTTFSVKKPNPGRSDIIEYIHLRSRLHLLFDKRCDVESDSVFKVRVIVQPYLKCYCNIQVIVNVCSP
jgi:hypothetical protein